MALVDKNRRQNPWKRLHCSKELNNCTLCVTKLPLASAPCMLYVHTIASGVFGLDASFSHQLSKKQGWRVLQAWSYSRSCWRCAASSFNPMEFRVERKASRWCIFLWTYRTGRLRDRQIEGQTDVCWGSYYEQQAHGSTPCESSKCDGC